MKAPQPHGRPLRADAERNRQRILEAAARLFARDGLEAGFDEIAREAGVGVGTVYRRFPDRERLLQALFEERLEAEMALVEGADRASDPAGALRDFAQALVEHHVADRGLKELVFSQAEYTDRMVGFRERATPVLERALRRAQDAGQLRPDIGLSDVMMAVFMAGSVGALTAQADPQQWRRQFTLLWGGLCVQAPTLPSNPLPSNPLTVDQLTATFNQGPHLGRRGTVQPCGPASLGKPPQK